jgi:hypothetical protein
MCTRALHWSLSWARWIKSILTHPISILSILMKQRDVWRSSRVHLLHRNEHIKDCHVPEHEKSINSTALFEPDYPTSGLAVIVLASVYYTFWNMIPCILLELYNCLEHVATIFRLGVQPNIQPTNFVACFLLSSIFYPEHEGSSSLWSNCRIILNHMGSYQTLVLWHPSMKTSHMLWTSITDPQQYYSTRLRRYATAGKHEVQLPLTCDATGEIRPR